MGDKSRNLWITMKGTDSLFHFPKAFFIKDFFAFLLLLRPLINQFHKYLNSILWWQKSWYLYLHSPEHSVLKIMVGSILFYVF